MGQFVSDILFLLAHTHRRASIVSNFNQFMRIVEAEPDAPPRLGKQDFCQINDRNISLVAAKVRKSAAEKTGTFDETSVAVRLAGYRLQWPYADRSGAQMFDGAGMRRPG